MRIQIPTAILFLIAFALPGCVADEGAGGAQAEGPHKEIILPEGASQPTLFSPVVRTGNLLFLSGVIGTGDDVEGVAEETRRVLERIEERLATAGAGREDVVKCTVFLVDMGDYGTMNEVYSEFFRESPPARSAIAVRELPAGALVEIECIAAAA